MLAHQQCQQGLGIPIPARSHAACPRQHSHPSRQLSHDSGSICHSGARQGSGDGKEMELQSLSPWFVIPCLADTQAGSWGLESSQEQEESPSKPQGQNQASLGEGRTFTTLCQAAAKHGPLPSPSPAQGGGHGTPGSSGDRAEARWGSGGRSRAEPAETPGRTRGRGDALAQAPRGLPASPERRLLRWGGGCPAGGMPGSGDAWLGGCLARPLPRPAAAQGALGPAAPVAPLPARPRGTRAPRVPPHLKSL